MLQETFNNLMMGFLKTEEGDRAVGQIVYKACMEALRDGLKRTIKIEDGKSEKGRVVEKEIVVDALEQILFYVPYIEAAIRGMQSDVGQARNRAGETRDVVAALVECINPEALRRAIEARRQELIGTISNQVLPPPA